MNNHSPSKQKSQFAFTLIELLTSMTISILIVGLLTATLAAAYNWSDSLQKNSTTRYDSKVGLDYFDRDFSCLTLPEIDRNSFSIVSEKISDDGGNEIESVWIQMLSRPPSVKDSGSIRTVSYRAVNTDPLTPGGNINKVAIYRSVVTPDPDENIDFLSASDSLYEDYWRDEWSGYESLDGGRTLLDDFLIENVAKFEVWLNYYTPDDQTTLQRQRVNDLSANDPVIITNQGFEGGNGVFPEPNIPVSVTVSVTTIAESAVPLMEDLISDWDEFLLREGVTLSRTYPFSINP